VSSSYVKVDLRVGVSRTDVDGAVDSLRDYNDENHLGWRVSRMPEAVRIQTRVYEDQLEHGALQALSQVCQEAEIALTDVATRTTLLPTKASATWYGPEEKDDDEGEEER
jgi:hypothetical protein